MANQRSTSQLISGGEENVDNVDTLVDEASGDGFRRRSYTPARFVRESLPPGVSVNDRHFGEQQKLR